MALLIANDARKHPPPGSVVKGSSQPLESFDDDALDKARVEIALEMPSDGREEREEEFTTEWDTVHKSSSSLPGLGGYDDDEDESQLMTEAFNVRTPLIH